MSPQKINVTVRVRSVAQKNSALHLFHCIFAMQNISVYFVAFDTPEKTLYPLKCRVLHIRLFRARSVDFVTLHFDRKRCFLIKHCIPNNFFCSVMNSEALQEQKGSAFRIQVFLQFLFTGCCICASQLWS